MQQILTFANSAVSYLSAEKLKIVTERVLMEAEHQRPFSQTATQLLPSSSTSTSTSNPTLTPAQIVQGLSLSSKSKTSTTDEDDKDRSDEDGEDDEAEAKKDGVTVLELFVALGPLDVPELRIVRDEAIRKRDDARSELSVVQKSLGEENRGWENRFIDESLGRFQFVTAKLLLGGGEEGMAWRALPLPKNIPKGLRPMQIVFFVALAFGIGWASGK